VGSEFEYAAEAARKRGFGNLAELYDRMAAASNPVEPGKSEKPRICLVYTTSNWCEERLSRELASQFSGYDCRMVAGGDGTYLGFGDDIYLVRSIGRIPRSVPDWARKRIVAMIQSDRSFDSPSQYDRWSSAAVVVAQNRHLQERARSLGIVVHDQIIANGVNLEEFHPSGRCQDEFIVGASGNFSSDYFDEWKGFSRYIVPACRMAGVRLKWCGWKGTCPRFPDIPGEHIPLEKMGEWYRSLSCLVSMSKSEGCSGAVFEAMASGIPVISTKVGWHSDVCSDELIWANRPNDATPENVDASVKDLAMKIRALRDNRSICKLLGEKARAFAEQWPHSRISDQWRVIIGEIQSRG